MAKESGLGITIGVDDSSDALKQLEGDITNFSWTTPRGVQDSSGVNSSANEAILLRAGFTATLNGIFNDAANLSHDVFKDVSSTSVTRTLTIIHSSQTLTVEVILTDYPLTNGADGSLTWSVPAQLNSTTVPTWP